MGPVLAIDVGNATTGLALWRGAVLLGRWRLASDRSRTLDELRYLVRELLRLDAGPAPTVRGIALACVVPEIEAQFCEVGHDLFNVDPLVVGPGVRTGVPIAAEDPRDVGADRIANAVAAVAGHGSPCIVLDFATALTVDVVGTNGAYEGAIIAPGIEVVARALARGTAGLPSVALVPPATAIANNTVEGLQSGLVFGYQGLVEGLIARVQEALGPAKVVATGDAPWAPGLVAAIDTVDAYDPMLTLEGLRLIFERSRGGRSG